ncbi:MAG: TolB family protein [Chloroflexota bacterium]
MTTDRSTVTDALIARALAERARGPEVSLLAPIMASVSATPQRRGVLVRLGLGHRTVVLGFAAVTLAVSLVAAAVIGSMVLRPSLLERPLPGNGPITAQLDGGIVEVDPLSGRGLSTIPLPRSGIGSATDLAWSPDGSHLAIATGLDVSIVDVASGQTSTAITCAYCPVAWSPDGTELALADRQAILVIDPLDGRLISRIEMNGPGLVTGITWAPDGRRLAFARGGPASLSVIDRDGSRGRSLALPKVDVILSDPSWSRDGSTIAYIESAVDIQDGAKPLDVVLLDPEGARSSRVVNVGECFCVGFSPALTWSPDGRFLAYTALTESGSALFVANGDGTEPRAISSGTNGALAWRPVPPAPSD